MTSVKIQGKLIQQSITNEIGQNVTGKKVVFIQFGENSVSQKFVSAKMEIANILGVEAQYIVSDIQETDQAVLLVQECARKVDGVVVQLPLPKMLDARAVCDSIPPEKDIDLLSTKIVKPFEKGETKLVPPVARAVFEILERECLNYTTKNIVLIGYGKLVGEPTSTLLKNKNIKHIVVDISTPKADRARYVQNADIIITGTGMPHSIVVGDIKEGCILIDAGTSEQGGVLVGDVHPSSYTKASKYTPVPGGVGPITVACLFQNLSVQD